jgi:hypothetical protein
MGLVRKTASIGTLGLIRFRSKKERLARATGERDRALSQLALVRESSDASKRRARKAERRARRSELQLLAAGTRRRGKRRLRRLAASAQDQLQDALPG